MSRICRSPKISKSSFHCRVKVMVVLAIGLSVIPSSVRAAQAGAFRSKVKQLLKQLDANNYQTREAAANELTLAGDRALRPMVMHSFSSSPESSWRIRSIIEEIGVAGSEATFYKSTGILRLLYPLDDGSMADRLENLRQQWQLTRKNRVIERLRELGATISDPGGDQVANAGQQAWQMANGGRVIINGRVLNQRSVSISSTQKKKAISASSKKKESLTRHQLIKRVDELLESDLATNRDRIFGGEDRTGIDQNASALKASPLGGDPFARNALRFNQVRFGAMALFDGNFRGSAEDLKALVDIPNLTLIHWKDRQLDAEELKVAHRLPTIRRVHFENCEFPKNSLPESAWPRLATHYEFINQTIPVSAIERLQDSPVTSLKFSSCSASDILHKNLRQLTSLSQLALEETLVDKQWFDSFAAIRSLTRVNLNLCKFDPDDYRNLARVRPNLLVDFTPQAFLGIRSQDLGNANLQRARMIARMRAAQKANPNQKLEIPDMDLPAEGSGCVISEVIRDSGADKAGLQSGDVIKKIDGLPITVFEDIRLIIAQHRAGEKLSVQFSRDGTEKAATIELGSFAKAAAAIR